jgi:UDP-N-acetylmuramate: L-alanyl-gamma-D-glutamyl-meso-diaminopimelate ligase
MRHIHFIAIGGSIMHSLAIAMHNKGYAVTGSDDEIYEPSRSRLQHYGLLPALSGWNPEVITKDIDIVVLGMHARADNPELLKAKELGLKIQSFPEFIYDLSVDKTRVVVAGSHGKTTTSGMIAHVLSEAGVPADRMIGATIGSLEPVTITDAEIIVLEGDEYLSSPEDSRPKFLHYHPNITVVTGIAWDHMNVFPTFQSYIDPFRQLIESQGENDILIYCQDDPDLQDLVGKAKPGSKVIPYTMHPYEIEDGIVSLVDEHGHKYPLRIFGIHNMQNLSAAFYVCKNLGLSPEAFYKAMESFEGASKRLQLIHKGEELIAYLDFAHAPSKVRATVKAVREKHKNEFIVAILELHTFSSLNPQFLPQYKNALKEADEKIIYYSPHTLEIKKLPDLSPDLLNTFFDEENLMIATSGQQLEELLRGIVLNKKTILLWMSSGRFDGLEIRQISESLERKS